MDCAAGDVEGKNVDQATSGVKALGAWLAIDLDARNCTHDRWAWWKRPQHGSRHALPTAKLDMACH